MSDIGDAGTSTSESVDRWARFARSGWRLAAAAFWADEHTLVGGDPFRSMRLTDRGASLVRAVLAGDRVPTAQPETALVERLARANLLWPPNPEPALIAEVTLVIPARASARMVQRVLDSSPAVPAIVVDDGSTPPLQPLLRHASPLRVIRHETSLGPAAARNAGASAASTEWIAFVDADVQPSERWIDRLMGHAARAVAIAPRIVTAPADGVAARFERAVCALDMGTAPGFVNPSGVRAYLPSAALLVRREDFLAVAGFDESMHVGEDVDLIWRLADRGVFYEPEVIVTHEPRATLSSALRRRAAYGESAAPLAQRHPALMHHGSFPAMAAFPWLLVIAGHPGLAALASAAHVARAPRSTPHLPAAAARRIAAYGQVRTAYGLSRNLSRPLLPLTLTALLAKTGIGRRAAAAAGAAAILARHSASGAMWQLLDDAAYSAGVWRAALRARRPHLLAPRLRIGRPR